MKYNFWFSCSIFFQFIITSCDRNNSQPDPPVNPPETFVEPVDPATAETIGFFLDNWKERSFSVPSNTETTVTALQNVSQVVIDASKIITKVPASMLGQNSVSFVENLSDDPVLMDHLRKLSPNVIRFPGGSRSDVYFWNRSFQDKPTDAPDSLYDGDKEVLYKWNYWYGKNNPVQRANLEDYYNLLRETGSQGMITVNYGYARYGLSNNPVAQAAHLAAEWVRYDNGRTRYWEIGNENHGAWEDGYRINTRNNKDGQPEYITGALYARHAKVFIDSMKKAAAEIGKEIYIGVGVAEEAATYALWNHGVMNEMKLAGISADFYIIHSYFLRNHENTYETIVQSALNKTGGMAAFIKSEYSKYGEKVKPIALTEYNLFAVGSAGSMQQVSFVNGMHTTLVLGEAIKNRLGSAVRWDLANGWDNGADHGMFNKGDEPGADKWNPRPVFYYMYYFQKMFGDRMLESTSSDPHIHTYASSFSSGQKGVLMVNKSRAEKYVKITLKNAKPGARYYWYKLTGGTDNGDFSRKVFVNDIGPEGNNNGGPVNQLTSIKAYSASTKDGIRVLLPPRSVIFLVADK